MLSAAVKAACIMLAQKYKCVLALPGRTGLSLGVKGQMPQTGV